MEHLLARSLTIKITYFYNRLKKKEIRKLVMRKNYNESSLHIALKLLSYIYFWNEFLIIEPLYRYKRYRPDLISWKQGEIPYKNESIPKIWIECKDVKLKKIINLGKGLVDGKIYWINTYNSLNRNLKTIQNKKQVKVPKNIYLIGIKISRQDISFFNESFSKKLTYWNVFHKKKDEILILVNGSESINVIFHPFSL